MENLGILKLSIYQIQMFLSVAKTESITLSAKQLHLSPSMLSKNIAGIERELRLILFLREKGRLKLTPAGQIMQNELAAATELIENAIEKAYLQQAVETFPLKIGFPESVDQKKYLIPSIQDYKAKNQDFRYTTEFFPVRDLAVDLHRGNLDIIFVPLFEKQSLDSMGLRYEVITRFPLTVFMTENNSLAEKTELHIEELKAMKLVTPSPSLIPHYYQNMILSAYNNARANPNVTYFANSSDAVVANVTESDEILISDRCRRIEPYKLVGVPLANSESGVILAWRENGNRIGEAFIRNTVDYWKTHTIE